MPEAAPSLPILRFGVFELDLRAGELRKQGLKIRLQEKPLQVLALLLEHPGQVVTREELRQQLWAGDTFVDFDHGINTAIKKLREALGDSSESPHFIETLPRHGYRFIGHVEPIRAVRAPPVTEQPHPASAEPGLSLVPDRLPGDTGPNLAAAIAGTSPGRPQGPALSSAKGSRLRRVLPWAMAGAFLIFAAVIAVTHFRTTSVQVQPTRSLIPPPEKVSFAFTGPLGAPVLSPDGTRLVFPARDASGKEALWVRRLDSLNAQRLKGTEGASFPFWAPDSRQLGFFQDRKLKKIDVMGGPPVVICDARDAPLERGGTWNRNNVIVFALGDYDGLWSVSASGGTPTLIASPERAGSLLGNRWPVFLPDGRHFLYRVGGQARPGKVKYGIYVGEIGSSDQKFLLHADSQALYSPPGFLLFLRGGNLMAQPFDAENLKLEGEAFPLAGHVGYLWGCGLGLFSVSRTGLLVYAASEAESGGLLVWMSTKEEEIMKVPQFGISELRLSPDAKRLAYDLIGSAELDVWVMDLKRGVQTPITFGPGDSQTPVWSPDGSRIAYASYGGSLPSFNIFVKNATGAGKAELLLKSDANKFPSDWSRDGRYILFTSINPREKTHASIWVLPLFGDRKPFRYVDTMFNEQNAVFSPDGHWVAYQSDESGTIELYVSPFPAGAGKWQVSQGSGLLPRWKGSALYYKTHDGKVMKASVKEKGSAVEIGTPRQLFQMTGGEEYDFAVTPDGKCFLVNKPGQGASSPLTLVTNWTAGLKK